MLRVTVGPRGEVTGQSWGDLENLRSSSTKSRSTILSGARSMHGKDGSSIHNFSLKNESKRPFGSKRHKMGAGGSLPCSKQPTGWNSFFYQNAAFNLSDTPHFVI